MFDENEKNSALTEYRLAQLESRLEQISNRKDDNYNLKVLTVGLATLIVLAISFFALLFI